MGKHCWNGNTTIHSAKFLFRVDVAVSNIKVFSVAIGMQQWVPFHWCQSTQSFVELLTKVNIQNCVCVYILAQRHKNRFFSALYCIFISCPHGRTIFSTFSHKKHDFRKNVIELKCVFWFSLQLMSEIFFITRRIQLNIIVNVDSRHAKYSLFLSDINEVWIFSTELWIIFKYRISGKSVQ